jgi:hypothetical protein
MPNHLGDLATLKRESHPACSAGWLPMCQLAGDIEEDTTERLSLQRLGGFALIPRILRTHWWRNDEETAAWGQSS